MAENGSNCNQLPSLTIRMIQIDCDDDDDDDDDHDDDDDKEDDDDGCQGSPLE